MKKIYRFTYQEAIHALEQLHPDLVPEWIPSSQRPSDYVEVWFEIELPEQEAEKPRGTSDNPLYIHADTSSPADKEAAGNDW